MVVPANVDIATTEALKMAQEVDPSGERTLGECSELLGYYRNLLEIGAAACQP